MRRRVTVALQREWCFLRVSTAPTFEGPAPQRSSVAENGTAWTNFIRGCSIGSLGAYKIEDSREPELWASTGSPGTCWLAAAEKPGAVRDRAPQQGRSATLVLPFASLTWASLPGASCSRADLDQAQCQLACLQPRVCSSARRIECR